jgi:hypothetical protein
MRLTIVLLLLVLAITQPSSAQNRRLQEVRVRWETYTGAPAPQVAQPATNVFTVERRRWVSGSLPRHRDPKLSEDRLVIVALDAQGRRVHS